MPSGICNTLLMGASISLPPSASTLRAGTGALAGPDIYNILDFPDGTLGSATWLSVSLSTSIRSITPWAMPPGLFPPVCLLVHALFGRDPVLLLPCLSSTFLLALQNSFGAGALHRPGL